MRALCSLAFCLVMAGCSAPPLPGLYFEVDLSLGADGCNDPAVGYEESLVYRVELIPDSSDAVVAVEGDAFAHGSISGCTLTYSSVAWTEERDAGAVRWSLEGQAEIQRGDGSCGNATDWLGTETITVLTSEDPTIRPGCTYRIDVVGRFVEEVLPE